MKISNVGNYQGSDYYLNVQLCKWKISLELGIHNLYITIILWILMICIAGIRLYNKLIIIVCTFAVY